MIDIYDNKDSLLNKQPSILKYILLTIIPIILLIYFAYSIKIYDNYLTKGFITCDIYCTLNVSIPSNIKFEKVMINKKESKLKLLSETIKIDETNLISYKELIYKLDTYKNNEIVEVNFYYNLERLIIKIKNKIF